MNEPFYQEVIRNDMLLLNASTQEGLGEGRIEVRDMPKNNPSPSDADAFDASPDSDL